VGRASAILLVIAAIALPSIGSAQQKLYKWTDENGIVHYSVSIPPEYTQRPDYPYRDRRLDLLESQIKLTEVYLGNLRKRLLDLQAEASGFKPYSTRPDAPQISDNLPLDMARTTASITLYEQALTRMLADQAALKDSADDTDVAPLIEIKAG
jgi:hypothetical protein